MDMPITYIRRHGWRHTFLAFLNFLLWFGVVIQFGSLMAVGFSQGFYSQIVTQLGFREGTFMGFGFAL